MNVGKSTLMNALLGQQHSIVSPEPGTTTDPVRKIMEIQGLGPVVLVDTAGVDDASLLGAQRVQRTLNIIDNINLAILVFEGNTFGEFEQSLVYSFTAKKTPFFLVHSKSDLEPLTIEITGHEIIESSPAAPNTEDIFRLIKKYLPQNAYAPSNIFEGLVKAGDNVILVMPQDAGAPQGRIILPQVQAVRTLLDLNANAICTNGKNLTELYYSNMPVLVVTDSSVFSASAAALPESAQLTSFSILFSRLKGDFFLMLKGVEKIKELKDGDRVLIMESCTHNVSHCDDIGRHKIPAMLQKCSGKKLEFAFTAGLEILPDDISSFVLAVQCGGCMLTRTQVVNRIHKVAGEGVAVTNYGMVLAYCAGILPRSIRMFD